MEPMWGIFSNHPLDDETVYDDDIILHASDQDLDPCRFDAKPPLE